MNSRHIVLEFAQRNFEGHPPPSTLVLCIIGFAIVQTMGFDPKDARLRDIDVGITLSRFYIKATIWLLTLVENWNWVLLDSQNARFFYTSQWPYVVK
jgi:hypothetical protein